MFRPIHFHPLNILCWASFAGSLFSCVVPALRMKELEPGWNMKWCITSPDRKPDYLPADLTLPYLICYTGTPSPYRLARPARLKKKTKKISLLTFFFFLLLFNSGGRFCRTPARWSDQRSFQGQIMKQSPSPSFHLGWSIHARGKCRLLGEQMNRFVKRWKYIKHLIRQPVSVTTHASNDWWNCDQKSRSMRAGKFAGKIWVETAG